MPTDHVVALVASYRSYLYAGAPQGQLAAIYVRVTEAPEGDPQELRLLFYPTESELPRNRYEEDSGVGFAHERVDRYADYMDLLRTEGSLDLSFGLETEPPYFVLASRDDAPRDAATGR